MRSKSAVLPKRRDGGQWGTHRALVGIRGNGEVRSGHWAWLTNQQPTTNPTLTLSRYAST
ncbi:MULTISPECIES: hypothetical protein [Fischerella]|uniref:hypothetical protein n=1 Tax=Fischerella TaxID=1190 RepID=UPI0002F5AA15|nr:MULTISPECIES: hypothetical protein [Fischerella]